MFKISIQFNCDWLKKRKPNNQDENTMTGHLMSLASKTIKELGGARSKSTVDNYLTAIRSFCRFAGKEVLLEQLDARLLERYQQWLIDRHVAHNTISCYMRSLRSLLHLMSKDGRYQSLFDTTFTGKTKTDKRSITLEEIIRIRDLTLPPDSSLAFYRDIFLFSFYALGMPFVDIAFLQKSQLGDGYIVYFRRKTSQRIRVKLEPPMQQIIDNYSQPGSPYVFPILSARGRDRLMTEYESALTQYNRVLKKIGSLAGLQHVLTSYVARHSWASIAYNSNIDLSVISKALGHTSPNTTLTYIREIDDNRIDQANYRLLAELK